MTDMTVLDRAIRFAVDAHSGAHRKGTSLPYILHPMEAAAIAASMTDDMDIIAAAVLHDVAEDTPFTLSDLRENFGARIAELVGGASEDKMAERPAADTWRARKQHTVDSAAMASREQKIVIFSDKLANLRTIHRDFTALGEVFWQRFNEKDPHAHLWYYGSFLDTCAVLSDTEAYREYAWLIGELRRKLPV